MWPYWIAGAVLAYILLVLYFLYLVHRIPRKPVKEVPDWGRIIDTRIPSIDGGSLEVWRVEPEGRSRGIVLFAHGWSRNRDRMVSRARVFGQLGFTTVIHSARDHGNSTPYRFMNAFCFAEDTEAVLKWINEPVLLYGHSLGAAGAIIVANRNPDKISLLFLEGCYARTKEALRKLYRNYNRFFGIFFAPMVVFFMDIFYRFRLDEVSPVRLASDIDIPVLIIHGELDQSFPLHHAWRLRDSFPAGRAELFVGIEADHSSSSLTPEYPVAIKSFVNRHLPLPD
ncbi:MAG: alpha/beta hydrolase [Deltaproteobacteria bacterium]|nr:alpha/beta hydrolase [Deltaproteobacteria bacterium]MBW1736536.1 alpha/beta hydrolase [Deltaproteobacteria bacterium]MBW1909174.1 alpha/beta hydrolase [Deltaproteobacteria bacterium]MBW2032617.1 alpha/beta hydrolase [Deltaproteobacteria bacterium]MBW2113524.1 alpha/beta hydrolase [Deltaproteobacteria bacterium]